tara:strand:+ start:2720 stop:4048 length:1329 start_codon:yes stop_codon:yes gene_type:complete
LSKKINKMKFDIFDYLKNGRYRPKNLIESIVTQFLNLFYIKRSKNFSFHILWYKSSPNSSNYYNKFGRFVILISNFLSVILFNKLLIKGIGLGEDIYVKSNKGNNNFCWPELKNLNYNNIGLKNIDEIKKKIDSQYLYSKRIKIKSDLLFWKKNRELFEKNFFDKNGNVIQESLINFRNSKIEFSSNLLLNNNIENLKTRLNKLRALRIFIMYHKVAELVDEDIIINITDNNIGNASFIHYRKQIINERLLRQGYFLSQIRKYAKLDERNVNIFCDIGPGYGMLPSILRKEFNFSKFILVDLPELNILSYYFLKNLFPESKICLSYEIENEKVINKELINKYDFMILEQNDLKKLEDKVVDCTINTASLGEMSKTDQDYYINQIERLTKKYFYSVNRHRSDNIHFSSTEGYYDFQLNNEIWKTRLYNFSPTFHIEALLEKKN